MSKCKHCLEEFETKDKPKGWMANHSRWCSSNPKSKVYKEELSKRTEKLKENGLIKNQFILAKENGEEFIVSDETRKKISESQKGKVLTKEHKDKLRESALKANYQKVCKRTVDYKCLDGSIVKLDSSWEVKLAKLFDSKDIKWVRPKPLIWADKEGIEHNYFPDFYLVDYGIYLDPKNDWVIETQKDKLKALSEQYDNIYILRENELNLEYILKITR